MLGLGLGLGLGSGKSGFTVLQLQELEHQALIFKYMVAGVPVPFHLVLPIWKSVAGSSYHNHHPSCTSLPLKILVFKCWSVFFRFGSSKNNNFFNGVGLVLIEMPVMAGCGGAGGLWYDYRSNSMEAEPGRCRRTDGKKWRCSKDVVPDQKYCERHMHRGRLRSRKPVETPSSSTAIATTTPTTTFNNNTHLSISIPTGLQLMTSSSASTATTMNNNNNNNSGSSSRFGFSPTRVLQTGICKTEIV
ncbi:Growth-regulating factor 12 [Acorus gramineus]|uniref:Growth-regulating factor n=1 Tax=Acorus gramineus TaxID=55184 RepID=A0AAV9AED7_ACOGR|nr:Growth-regulating factor 12 [Acorus gramineus]